MSGFEHLCLDVLLGSVTLFVAAALVHVIWSEISLTLYYWRLNKRNRKEEQRNANP